MSPNIRITGAGAGTGKTHRLCEIISNALADGKTCRPGAFIATTFTRKAASELTERVRTRLLKGGLHAAALRVEESLVGTVHSVCSRILERFAFDAGVSPRLRVLDEALEGVLLGGAIEECFNLTDISGMERLSRRLGQTDARTFSSKWKQQVRDIISAARSNKIDPAALGDMARQSVDELRSYLPAITDDDLESPLIAAIESAIGIISGNGDETKKTAECLEFLNKAKTSLLSGNLPWSDWCKLSKLEAAKASHPDLAHVKEAASRSEENPRLHEDLSNYITRIFQLAGEALEIYQTRKKVRGMLDFTDLEVLTLELLEQPHVRDCLRKEYDLLVVDEFQDTSPIQLELFVRLAELVKQTHWVGDTKQAIYGFRGCDPQLMQAAEIKFRAGHKPKPEDLLSDSRRHRPELVKFFNGLFPDVFAKTKGIRRKEVELRAHRKGHPSLSPAVELWTVSNGRMNKNGTPSAINSGEFESCIVGGIRDLTEQGLMISDKERQTDAQEVPRALRWRDIAVLCRTNDKASALAARLQANGIPAARRTQGLMSTPEAVLALACLRWLSDERDSVAAAEILMLEASRDIGDWLEDRLGWVRDQSSGAWGIDGNLKSEVLNRIQSLRERLKLLTPSELLDSVLILGDLAGIVSQWNAARSANRRANLEALRGLASEYESSCHSAGIAASHVGLLIWCDELATSGKDHGAIDESTDAVQVMTWHGSKGLEWPVVICLDLSENPRPRIWNSPIAVSPLDFDPDKPLAGRWLRFWPYPFGPQVKDVPFSDRILSSEAGLNAADEAGSEQSRLHYVVMTRARDYLIFPTDGKNEPWLPPGVTSTVFGLAKGNPAEDSIGGVRRRFRYLKPGEDEEDHPVNPSVMWFAPPLAPREFPPAEITPSSLPPFDDAVVGDEVVYCKPLNLAPGQNDRDIGNALHAILASHLIDPNNPDFQIRACGILEAHHIQADTAEIVTTASAFHRFLTDTFQPTEVLVEVPFTHRNALGQRITGFMDLVLITSEGAVLIDHKSYAGSNLKEHSAIYSGQMSAYREALNEQGLAVSSSWIHYCTQGKLRSVL
jgi:ATP-dependent helicase/nuclease subunit A